MVAGVEGMVQGLLHRAALAGVEAEQLGQQVERLGAEDGKQEKEEEEEEEENKKHN